jgi:FAD/FMN-containing dehydrogenase
MEINPNYLVDASGFTGWADQVHTPAAADELSQILRTAYERRIPVTIAGAGSGLTGARVPQGGLVLSIERFRDLEVGPGAARAGAAVTLLDLDREARKSRQFFAPDPTEITASVGGVIATNASGSRSFRYGSTRRHIRRLRFALMDGSIVEASRGDRPGFPIPAIPLPNTTKCTAGYRLSPDADWIDLVCGSEGTLAVVLEAELALLPAPQELFAGVIFFDSDDRALDAVGEWRGVGNLRMLEYLDRQSLQLLRAPYPEIPRAASAALLIEAEGDDIEPWEARLIASQALIEGSWFAVTAADRERFRVFRHTLPELINATVLERGFMKMGTDYAVPLDRNREMLAYYRRELDRALAGQYAIFGHIGDAHVHVNMLPASAAQADIATALLTAFARHAVSLGGTVSAEHGLGKRKAHLLAIQYAPRHIEAMKGVKRRLDPRWLLGRGTLFDVPDDV